MSKTIETVQTPTVEELEAWFNMPSAGGGSGLPPLPPEDDGRGWGPEGWDEQSGGRWRRLRELVRFVFRANYFPDNAPDFMSNHHTPDGQVHFEDTSHLGTDLW